MKLKYFLLLAAIPLLLAGCKSKTQKDDSVLVSIAPYYPIAKELCEGVATVKIVIPADQNIHLYEPKPAEIAQFADASIWFGVGEGIEKKVLPALRQHSPITYCNLSQHIPLIRSTDNLCGHSHHASGKSNHHHHHFYDLHIWMSPELMIKQLDVMKEALIKWKPNLAELIEANARRVHERLKKLNHEIKERLSPYKGDAILVTHSALGYFCQSYDLVQFSVECEGKEPSPRDIEKLLAKLRNTQIRCAFKQRQVDNRAITKIAADLTTPLYLMDPYDIDYYKNLIKIASEIAN